MRVLSVVILALVCAAACAPVGQAGAPRLAGQAGAVGLPGVELSGSSAVWARQAARYATPAEIVAAHPGEPVRVLLRAPVTRGSAVEQLPRVDADRGRIVVALNDFVRYESGVRIVGSGLWAGTTSAPLASMRGPRHTDWVSDVSVSGSATALLVGDRTDERERARLLLRPSRAAAWTQRTTAAMTMDIELAGRYVATVRQPDEQDRTFVTVRDRRGWRAVTRVVVPEDALDIDIALRRDGTLAVVYGTGRLRLATASPGARRLTRLAGRAAFWEIEWGPRGVIYPQQMRGGPRLVESRGRRSWRPLTARVRGLVGFASEGDRLALRTRSCVYVARVPVARFTPRC